MAQMSSKITEKPKETLLWSESTLTFESCGPREASWELAMRSPSLIEDVEKIARSVGLRENILTNGHDGALG